jgi:molecular chaperone DnaJ
MDHYKILGVSRDATSEEIRQAYRKLARKYHPDANRTDEGAADKFKKVAGAYEVLNDPEKKAQYDRFGDMGGQTGHRRGPFTNPLEDFFSNFFVNNPFGKDFFQEKGKDIVVDIELELRDILTEIKRDVEYSVRLLCDGCNGKGGSQKDCDHCGGRGFTITYGDNMDVKENCSVCGGGKVFINDCHKCGGVGFSEEKKEKIKVKIPSGIEDKTRLRYQSLGEPSKDGINGDLIINIRVKKHEFFDRLDHGNLLVKVPVSYTQLVFGDKVLIPGIEGKLSFDVPKGTNYLNKFKLSGQGLPRFNDLAGNRGDLIVELCLEVPTDLSDDYVVLLEKLAKYEKS